MKRVKRRCRHVGYLEDEIMTSKVVVAPQFEDTKSEQYRYVFATGVFGGVNPVDAQIIFWLDRPEPETASTPQPGSLKLKKIVRELQVEVHMTPTAFKTLADWMNKHIEQYEKMFGPIAPSPKKAKKTAPPEVYT